MILDNVYTMHCSSAAMAKPPVSWRRRLCKQTLEENSVRQRGRNPVNC